MVQLYTCSPFCALFMGTRRSSNPAIMHHCQTHISQLRVIHIILDYEGFPFFAGNCENVTAVGHRESLVKTPNSFWWPTKALLVLLLCYWKHLGFDSFGEIWSFLDGARHSFCSLLAVCFSFFSLPNDILAHVHSNSENKKAADGFFLKPLLWITDHVKTRCGFQIANISVGRLHANHPSK